MKTVMRSPDNEKLKMTFKMTYDGWPCVLTEPIQTLERIFNTFDPVRELLKLLLGFMLWVLTSLSLNTFIKIACKMAAS